MRERRCETGNVRQEMRDRRCETGDTDRWSGKEGIGQEAWEGDRRCNTGDMRHETGDRKMLIGKVR